MCRSAWRRSGRGRPRRCSPRAPRPRLLAGPRGLPAVPGGVLVDLIHAVAALMVIEPRIQEIDVNPLIAGADLIAVDALVILGP